MHAFPMLAVVLSITAVLVCSTVSLVMFYRLRMRAAARRCRLQAEARLEERQRIARELHDTLLQSIQGMLLQVDAAASCLQESDPVRLKILNALDHAQNGIVEARDKVHDLRTSSGFDLIKLLRCRGEDLSMRTGTGFRFDIIGGYRQLVPEVMEDVFYIVLEAMENAFRHSGACMVSVFVTYESRNFTVVVEDNGKGIGTAALRESESKRRFGMIGMYERAQNIGSSLHLTSKEMSGTSWRLVVPFAVAFGTESTWYEYLVDDLLDSVVTSNCHRHANLQSVRGEGR